MKHAKILAIATVAVFCISAFAFVVSIDDESSAASKVSYDIYLQLNDGTSSYSKWLPTVSVTGTVSQAALSEAVNTACTNAGITAEYSAGWATSFTVDGHKYTGKGTWSEKKDYWNFAQYYGDGDAWKEVQTYNEAATVAIVLDEYQFSEPSDKDKYYENPYGYWTVLPTVSPGDFDKKDDNNTMLYVGIGVGVAAVVVIAAVALVFLRKK